MAVIRFDGDNHSTADGLVVAVYDRDRRYGGPEEGGWWYTRRELVTVAFVAVPEGADEQAVNAAALALSDELLTGDYARRGRYRYTDVNYAGSGDYTTSVIEAGEPIVHVDPVERPCWS